MKITETGIDSGGIRLLKIEFGDGQWWEFRAEVNWGTSREIRKIVTQMAEGDSNLDLAHQAQMMRVLGSTESWSFKLPVVKASVDRIADWRVREVLDQMVEKHRTEGSTEETKKGFGWLSSLGRLFRWLTGRR